jgi:prepilin-type N-terminal cleavage/methylation domain-containing protein
VSFLKKFLKKSDLSRGFTLVELLVVIAIIGILSTLLLLQLNVARQKARDAKRVADMNQVRSALELYYDDEGHYMESNTLVDITAALSKYLTRIPTDPGKPACDAVGYVGTSSGVLNGCYGYSWETLVSPTKFHLWANLEQKATSALGNDLDLDTTAATGENFAGGAQVNGATETCADSTAVTCVYDLGQPN